MGYDHPDAQEPATTSTTSATTYCGALRQSAQGSSYSSEVRGITQSAPFNPTDLWQGPLLRPPAPPVLLDMMGPKANDLDMMGPGGHDSVDGPEANSWFYLHTH
jgi:hypothetical protein